METSMEVDSKNKYCGRPRVSWCSIFCAPEPTATTAVYNTLSLETRATIGVAPENSDSILITFWGASLEELYTSRNNRFENIYKLRKPDMQAYMQGLDMQQIMFCTISVSDRNIIYMQWVGSSLV